MPGGEEVTLPDPDLETLRAEEVLSREKAYITVWYVRSEEDPVTMVGVV
jgi:hypothetical protein